MTNTTDVVGVSADGLMAEAVKCAVPWSAPSIWATVQRPTGEVQVGPVTRVSSKCPLTALHSAASDGVVLAAANETMDPSVTARRIVGRSMASPPHAWGSRPVDQLLAPGSI